MTEESLPVEYIITGLRAPATASRKISMLSDSSCRKAELCFIFIALLRTKASCLWIAIQLPASRAADRGAGVLTARHLPTRPESSLQACLLYTSDAADE